MFASGVVKLQSGCKEWWGLTAMPLHYESQCIPTWLSWWAYNIPYPTLHKLSVALTFVTEIPVVLLFYHPVKSVRKFAFFLQAQLMIGIMLTGRYIQNFNFLGKKICPRRVFFFVITKHCPMFWAFDTTPFMDFQVTTIFSTSSTWHSACHCWTTAILENQLGSNQCPIVLGPVDSRGGDSLWPPA